MVRLEPIAQPNKIHIRGIGMASEQNIWCSGSNGTVINSKDGGLTWNTFSIPGADSIEFRDIEVFSESEVMVLSAGSPALIYQTEDAGATWNLMYENHHPDIFFDGMDFSEQGWGMVYGDPMNGRFALLYYDGKQFDTLQTLQSPEAIEGEAAFAASGTGIICEGNEVWFASGGAQSRIFHANIGDSLFTSQKLKMTQGSGRGTFSIAKNQNRMVAVGGSYIDSLSIDSNVSISNSGGDKWGKSLRPPYGYRSCVVGLPADSKLTFVTCGRSGIEWTRDGGKTWEILATAGFYTAAAHGKTVVFAGRNGRMGKMNFDLK